MYSKCMLKPIRWCALRRIELSQLAETVAATCQILTSRNDTILKVDAIEAQLLILYIYGKLTIYIAITYVDIKLRNMRVQF